MYRCPEEACRKTYIVPPLYGQCDCGEQVRFEPGPALSDERIERLNERLQPRHTCTETWQIAIREWKANRKSKQGVAV